MDILDLHGVVLKSFDHSEYDRRLIILTLERGKITAFARGAKRSGSALLASTEPFAFGTFKLTEGRSAYNLRSTEIANYFEGIRKDLNAFYLGSYFLEFTDYYSKENLEDRELLSLLYSSLQSLLSGSLDKDLIRSVFEIKIISIEGELPPPPQIKTFLPGTLHSLDHIISSPSEKLYTFNVNEEIKAELKELSSFYVKRCVNRDFTSLKILDSLHTF